MDERKQVPETALRLRAGAIEVGDNGDDAKTAPFKMVARSGDSIDHWYWGKVVHDLAGMRLGGTKVAIDYAHDDNQVIGYANHFSTDSGDLEVSGALTPYKDQDRASEVAHKAKLGVPYQASINFAGDGIKVEEFSEGHDVEVNGRTFNGPVTVIREWPLRGIAVCPYGADSNTSTEFKNTPMTEVKVMAHENEEKKLSDEATEIVADDAAAVDSETDIDSTVDATEETAAVETAQQPDAIPEAEPVAALSRTGPDFLERFGDIGGKWFALGKTWDECVELHEKEMQTRIDELETRLAQREDGEESPVDFTAVDKKTPQRAGLQAKIKQLMQDSK